jgi:MFS superfamily sulfate permease-like transporter
VHVVGHFPAGLALPRLPDLSFADLQALLPGALIVFVLGYVETIGIARGFAARSLAESHEPSDRHEHEKFHEQGHQPSRPMRANQELIALGVANVGAGLMQGFVVDANLSFSADNEESGARTPLSSLVAAGLTVLTALFLTPLFHNLPEATLAAIVIHAMLSLMDAKELKRYYHVRRLDFWVALVALVGVLLLGIVLGFLLAVIISIVALLYRASRPRFSVLGRAPGEDAYGDLERHPEYRPVPGLLLVRPNASLFFANAKPLHEQVRWLIAAIAPPPTTVLLDLEASDELDLSSADALLDLADELEAQGIELHLARVHAPALELLHRDGVVERIGEAHIHHTVHQGVEAFQQTRQI